MEAARDLPAETFAQAFEHRRRWRGSTDAEANGEVALDFWLDEGVGLGDSVEGWRERFEAHKVVILGPTPFGRGSLFDSRGRFPLMGVTARSVDSVEVTYRTGPPTLERGLRGGFVVMADATRPLREVVAYDRAGRVLERTDASYISDWGAHCEDPRGCPPGRWVRDVGY